MFCIVCRRQSTPLSPPSVRPIASLTGSRSAPSSHSGTPVGAAACNIRPASLDLKTRHISKIVVSSSDKNSKHAHPRPIAKRSLSFSYSPAKDGIKRLQRTTRRASTSGSVAFQGDNTVESKMLSEVSNGSNMIMADVKCLNDQSLQVPEGDLNENRTNAEESLPLCLNSVSSTAKSQEGHLCNSLDAEHFKGSLDLQAVSLNTMNSLTTESVAVYLSHLKTMKNCCNVSTTTQSSNPESRPWSNDVTRRESTETVCNVEYTHREDSSARKSQEDSKTDTTKYQDSLSINSQASSDFQRPLLTTTESAVTPSFIQDTCPESSRTCTTAIPTRSRPDERLDDVSSSTSLPMKKSQGTPRKAVETFASPAERSLSPCWPDSPLVLFSGSERIPFLSDTPVKTIQVKEIKETLSSSPKDRFFSDQSKPVDESFGTTPGDKAAREEAVSTSKASVESPFDALEEKSCYDSSLYLENWNLNSSYLSDKKALRCLMKAAARAEISKLSRNTEMEISDLSHTEASSLFNVGTLDDLEKANTRAEIPHPHDDIQTIDMDISKPTKANPACLANEEAMKNTCHETASTEIRQLQDDLQTIDMEISKSPVCRTVLRHPYASPSLASPYDSSLTLSSYSVDRAVASGIQRYNGNHGPRASVEEHALNAFTSCLNSNGGAGSTLVSMVTQNSQLPSSTVNYRTTPCKEYAESADETTDTRVSVVDVATTRMEFHSKVSNSGDIVEPTGMDVANDSGVLFNTVAFDNVSIRGASTESAGTMDSCDGCDIYVSTEREHDACEDGDSLCRNAYSCKASEEIEPKTAEVIHVASKITTRNSVTKLPSRKRPYPQSPERHTDDIVNKSLQQNSASPVKSTEVSTGHLKTPQDSLRVTENCHELHCAVDGDRGVGHSSVKASESSPSKWTESYNKTPIDDMRMVALEVNSCINRKCSVDLSTVGEKNDCKPLAVSCTAFEEQVVDFPDHTGPQLGGVIETSLFQDWGLQKGTNDPSELRKNKAVLNVEEQNGSTEVYDIGSEVDIAQDPIDIWPVIDNNEFPEPVTVICSPLNSIETFTFRFPGNFVFDEDKDEKFPREIRTTVEETLLAEERFLGVCMEPEVVNCQEGNSEGVLSPSKDVVPTESPPEKKVSDRPIEQRSTGTEKCTIPGRSNQLSETAASHNSELSKEEVTMQPKYSKVAPKLASTRVDDDDASALRDAEICSNEKLNITPTDSIEAVGTVRWQPVMGTTVKQAPGTEGQEAQAQKEMETVNCSDELLCLIQVQANENAAVERAAETFIKSPGEIPYLKRVQENEKQTGQAVERVETENSQEKLPCLTQVQGNENQDGNEVATLETVKCLSKLPCPAEEQGIEKQTGDAAKRVQTVNCQDQLPPSTQERENATNAVERAGLICVGNLHLKEVNKHEKKAGNTAEKWETECLPCSSDLGKKDKEKDRRRVGKNEKESLTCLPGRTDVQEERKPGNSKETVRTTNNELPKAKADSKQEAVIPTCVGPKKCSKNYSVNNLKKTPSLRGHERVTTVKPNELDSSTATPNSSKNLRSGEKSSSDLTETKDSSVKCAERNTTAAKHHKLDKTTKPVESCSTTTTQAHFSKNLEINVQLSTNKDGRSDRRRDRDSRGRSEPLRDINDLERDTSNRTLNGKRKHATEPENASKQSKLSPIRSLRSTGGSLERDTIARNNAGVPNFEGSDRLHSGHDTERGHHDYNQVQRREEATVKQNNQRYTYPCWIAPTLPVHSSLQNRETQVLPQLVPNESGWYPQRGITNNNRFAQVYPRFPDYSRPMFFPGIFHARPVFSPAPTVPGLWPPPGNSYHLPYPPLRPR